jgi:hypothetical protein
MKTALTNLLPEENIRAFAHRYYLRAGAVFLCMLSVVMAIHIGLLIPTFLYFTEDTRQKQQSLDYLNERLSRTSDKEKQALKAQVLDDAHRVLEHAPKSRSSFALVSMYDSFVSGVSVTRMSLSYTDNGTTRMSIAGTASSREVLQQYRQALLSTPGVLSADLPVSTFAKDKDIPFEITLAGTFTSYEK